MDIRSSDGLSGIDVRAEVDETGAEVPASRIEFGLFQDGIYAYSIMLSEDQARKLLGDLTELLP
jgi:hypothetical protein